MDKEGSQLIRGLEGVVAAETKLCDLDGQNGRLAYGGYDIDDLARRASFEEVCHLLWYGRLPNAAQLDKTTLALIGAREISVDLVQAFRFMPKATDPMRVLQAAVAMLGMSDPDTTDNSHAANLRKAIRLTSQMATAICAHHRVRSGEEPIRPAADLSHAANVLYMLTGKRPSGVVAEAGDPPGAILKGMAEEACRQSGQFRWYEMAVKLHARINETKKLIPNVDFYSAPLFYSLGIPVDLFTPVIAAGRIAGWTANIIEQFDDNRLIRPRGDYIGPSRRTFTPVDKR